MARLPRLLWEHRWRSWPWSMDAEAARWLAEDTLTPGSAAKYGVALGGNWALLWLVMAALGFSVGHRTAGFICVAGVFGILLLAFARARRYARSVGERARSYLEELGDPEPATRVQDGV
jgi:hypothetical protein